MDYFAGYLESLVLDSAYAKSTIEAYTGDVHRFSDYLERHFPENRAPEKVTPGMILDFLDEENRGGYSVSTLQRRKMALAHFAQYLSSVEVFTIEGIREILDWQRSNWQKIYARKVKVLSEQEANRLLQARGNNLSAIKKRDLAIAAIMLEAALQVGQVIRLRASAMDKSGNKWILNGQHLVVSSGLLKMYYEEGRPEFAPSGNEDTFFLSLRGGPVSRQGVWQIVKELGEESGIEWAVSPTILRYSAVARMVTAGVATPELQQRLGHTNISSTRALVRKIKRTTI